MPGSSVAVVIATRNRAGTLARTLGRLIALPDEPHVIVVDNASSDETERVASSCGPRVELIRLSENTGAWARTVGTLAAQTPYVAFCDDDCWWEAGSLIRAAEILDARNDVAVLNARVLVGAEERLDPTCLMMAAAGRVHAFMAGAAIVRRSAFLEVGGYHRRFHLGAEESLASVDLIAKGWTLLYCDELVLHHYPSGLARDSAERRRLTLRNRLWTAWLRHSSAGAFRATVSLARRARYDRDARGALAGALFGIPWIVCERRSLGAELGPTIDCVVGFSHDSRVP